MSTIFSQCCAPKIAGDREALGPVPERKKGAVGLVGNTCLRDRLLSGISFTTVGREFAVNHPV